MSERPSAPRRTLRLRADRWLRERDRQAEQYDRTRRFRDVVLAPYGHADWGHRLMALVGRDDSGSWSVPRVRDVYFIPDVAAARARSWRTGKAHRPPLRVTRDAMTAWDGVRLRGEEWRTFDAQDDGFTVRVGYLGDDGRLHDSGINGREELALFRRWLIWDAWAKAEWFGLRRWLYYRALHAVVEDRRPWTCQAVPDEGSGGYRHWHCGVRVGLAGTVRRWRGLPAGHPGEHRYRNYRWPGPGTQVAYDDVDPSQWSKPAGLGGA